MAFDAHDAATVRWMHDPTAAYAGPDHAVRRHYDRLLRDAATADATRAYEDALCAFMADVTVAATADATLADVAFDFEPTADADARARAARARAACAYPRLACKHWLLSSLCMKGAERCPFQHSIADGVVPPACDPAQCRRGALDCLACALAGRRRRRR
jgi:hypothetical protein